MKKKKISLILCAIISVTSLYACSTSNSTDTNITESQQTEENLIVKVTNIDGNTISAIKGTIESSSGGPSGDNMTEMPGGGEQGEGGQPQEMPTDGQTPPEMPEGTGDGAEQPPSGDESMTPSGEGGSETPPEMPSGEAPSGEVPSGEVPSGEVPSGGSMPGGGGQMGGGSSFVEGDDQITFTISDSATITIEMMEGTQDGDIDSITVNSILEIEFNDDNEVETIVIRNLMAGGGFGGSGTVTNGTSANTISEDSNISNETYTSTGDDENALRVDGASVTFDNITIEKTSGNSSNTEDGDFYGQNAGFLALNGANVTINNANVNTTTVNGNGIFSYGEGTVVNIADSTINTSANNSGGIQTTGGGTMNAKNLQIVTGGDSSAAIRSDRGGGIVTVEDGSYTTNGYGSPSIYSTADISASNATLTANNSEALVIEGKNSISLENCQVSGNMSSDKLSEGDNVHNIMIYQSMSGDAEIGHSTFTAKGGSITANVGDMMYVTNTTCTIELSDVQLNLANDVILRVAGNTSAKGWGTEGSNGGSCTFIVDNQQLDGDIIVDEISDMDMTIKESSSFEGTINKDGTAGNVKVSIDDTSSWTLTGDSYITEFDGDISNINLNGYKLYVNGEEV